MPIDPRPLWDFMRPEVSEQRFRAALETATGDDALILETQLARTHGMRRDFARARQILAAVEPRLADAGAEARVRYHLELGRTVFSVAHNPESQTAAAREESRVEYRRAIELAEEAGLDDLAIDALHMMAVVETKTESQLEWNRRAMARMEASRQPEARRWEGSLRNNLGCCLRNLGHYKEALAEFQLALAVRERGHDIGATRVAHWAIAKTLRMMGWVDDALAIQRRLEAEYDQAGEPDMFVFEELELLHRVRGDEAGARHYAAKRDALGP